MAQFNIQSPDDASIIINLQGSSYNSAAVSNTEPVEKINYDSRTLINPPPGFVEFFEKLRTVEPAKPR